MLFASFLYRLPVYYCFCFGVIPINPLTHSHFLFCFFFLFSHTCLFLMAQFGHIVLTTTFGIMDHEEARRKHTGGKILGFFYWMNSASRAKPFAGGVAMAGSCTCRGWPHARTYPVSIQLCEARPICHPHLLDALLSFLIIEIWRRDLLWGDIGGWEGQPPAWKRRKKKKI